MSFFSNFRMEINRAKSELILRPMAEPGEQVWDGKPALWWKLKFKQYNKDDVMTLTTATYLCLLA